MRISKTFFWLGCVGFFVYLVNIFLYSSVIPALVFAEMTDETISLHPSAEIIWLLFDQLQLGILGFWGGCLCWIIALIAKAFNR